MKKKIAICFSGLPSYIDQNKGYWLDVIEKYDADVYASLWGDEENVYQRGDTINNFVDSYKPIKIEVEKQEDLQSNTFRFLSEEFKEFNQELFKKVATGHVGTHDEVHHKLGRSYATLYKYWRANLLKDSLGRRYDIVVNTETCSSYPDLKLINEEEEYYNTHECLNIPYYNQSYIHEGKGKASLNQWLVFGNSDMMDYYCSAFLYVRKYYQEIYLYPPENILNHHISRRELPLRLFFTKIFRKGRLTWNGDPIGFDRYTKEEDSKDGAVPFIPDKARYTITSTEILESLNLKIPEIPMAKMKDRLRWSPQKEEVSEKEYLKSDFGKAQRFLDEEMSIYPKIKGYKRLRKEDKYGNVLPEYIKESDIH